MAHEYIAILGVRVSNVGVPESLAIIEGLIESGISHQLVTVNTEFVMAAQKDAEFKAIIHAAALALPDGIGLLWAARFLGRPLKERVTGVDTVQRVAELAACRGYRLFLLGAAEGVADLCAQHLSNKYPNLQIVGTYSGSPAVEEEDEIVALIKQAKPDVLFVAYGAPQQDKWIARNLERLEVPLAMGVGGAFDFIAGVAVRAPRWMQRLGLEWLHRLYHEPWRWRRMLALPRFLGLVMRERLGKIENHVKH
ncbi:MAG: WecB/TagA/CpsF family glycosyltransferase [Anaerolineae bacterium]|nr:WecB/TagA/CpsF family glycosyltransferase [Anaerolineae bacterium]